MKTLILLALFFTSPTFASGGDQSDADSGSYTPVFDADEYFSEQAPPIELEVCQTLMDLIEESEGYPSKRGVSQCLDGNLKKSWTRTSTIRLAGKTREITTYVSFTFTGMLYGKQAKCHIAFSRRFEQLSITYPHNGDAEAVIGTRAIKRDIWQLHQKTSPSVPDYSCDLEQ